jgi:cob(I)alamin adenosyltransferase
MRYPDENTDGLSSFATMSLLLALGLGCSGGRLPAEYHTDIHSKSLVQQKIPSMKIYTKTGDAGTTGLFGGPRVSKDDARICAYGSVDELNAVLGTARSTGLSPRLDQMLDSIQHQLFSIGAELASPEPEQHNLKWNSNPHVSKLEEWIDSMEAQLPALRNFILPGGSPQAAHLHLARTICRRVEREIVRLGHDRRVSDVSHIVIFLNRLSDLLFVMARYANFELGVADTTWGTPRTSSTD